MPRVGIRELKTRASAIVRHVREERAVYEVTHRGHVVARLEPAHDGRPVDRDGVERWIAEMDELAAEIGRAMAARGEAASDAPLVERREL